MHNDDIMMYNCTPTDANNKIQDTPIYKLRITFEQSYLQDFQL